MKRGHRIAGAATIVLLVVGAVIGVNHFKSNAAVVAPPPPDVSWRPSSSGICLSSANG